jgi:ribose transport system substrate-binding protein
MLVAALILAGCRGKSETTGGGGGAARKLTICVSIPSADHGWTGGVGWWAERAMAMYPKDMVEWVYIRADSPDMQVNQVRTAMGQKKLDGLVILCHESKPLTPIAKEAKGKGIYIVNVDRGFTEPVADVFLEGDNKAFGRKSARYMVDKLKAEGATKDDPAKIVVLRGIPCTVDTDRYNAAMEVFAEHPEIKILGAQPGYWSREKGLEVMKAFLTKHKEIDAVWAQDDDMAEGAETAIKEANRQKQMWMFGGAGKKTIVKRVMDGDPMYPADITYPPSMIAVGIHMCVSNLRDGKRAAVGEFMPKHIMLDVELITPANAKDYYFPDSVF